MEIVWLGHSSFRIKGKEVSVVTDPYDSGMIGIKFPKTEADIVTVSHEHKDHSKVDAVSGTPKVLSSPGEYEIKGVSVFGISTFHDDKQGAQRGTNTIFVIKIDNVVVCHLGDLGHKLSGEQIGEIGAVDVVLVPVGGVYTLDSSRASEVVSSLEPKVVIPMHYQVDGLDPKTFKGLASVDDFIKEIGVEPTRSSKFVVTHDKLPEEEQLVVLERRS
ncbi:lactamase [Candidatus Woesebacteria bacterium]|nr:lactamase [Candidatus Woesebacteria bacterium]